ncbi:MAG: sulfurtransferase [Proteobacteria bacterium]|nr:MAG: sulfurtransferase [Pseudomonadota bacterium]
MSSMRRFLTGSPLFLCLCRGKVGVKEIMRFLNASFYQFSALEDPATWAKELRRALRAFDVKGTLILAPEGINGFLAGEPAAVRESLAYIQRQAPFAKIDIKESESIDIPFKKFVVKVRPEIVTFRVPGHTPLQAAAPRLSAAELKSWYEEGREFLVLDTRNEYEVRLGKFKGAQSLNLSQFVELPAALAPELEKFRGKPVVTYCTGGIRCEKAAPYLRHLGLDAYQLDGGILRYFEDAGGDHWEGECFVFDERVAVDAALKATGAALCPKCQGPVPAATPECIHCGEKV